MLKDNSFVMPISEEIWKSKYQFKRNNEVIDNTVQATWRRVAKALAQAEKPEDQDQYEAEFYEALEDFKFLPAGRITSGAGTGRDVTLFNCFVMGKIEDDLGSIFDNLKEAALTMQAGGGIGYDFSTIRPNGAPVHGVDADASGPLSFMDTWDAMCKTIMSAGSRRGAMMAVLHCAHPDIEAFIDAKKDPNRLRMFNMSVLVTDAFMDAVKHDDYWDLVFEGKVYKTIEAVDLWNKIMESTYAYAEPGVIFIDRINEMNNLNYVETISATNPCFAYDTEIMTTAGYVTIGELAEQGEDVEVFCVDPATGKIFIRMGRNPRITGYKQKLLRIGFNDGMHVDVTRNHKMLTNYGETVLAENLKIGDHLSTTVGEKLEVNAIEVASIEELPDVHTVYNITVDEFHTVMCRLSDDIYLNVRQCGEQPLPNFGACLLGSINLTRFVDAPFADNVSVNYELLEKTVSSAVRMMDNVVDVSKFPLQAQKDEAKAKRRIGLGVTGLADMLMMLGLSYGDDEAVDFTEEIMRAVNTYAYQASINIAKEKGAFPLYSDVYLNGKFIKQLPKALQKQIKEHGIRNALVTSIAPTGTISLYAGNVSSGIEPVFAHEYTRKVLQKDGTRTEQVVEDYAVKMYREMHPDAELPSYFVTAQALKPEHHVRMQAAAQKHVDSSISKTVNVPEDISFNDFKQVYFDAYESGCKGCTTYRPNDVTGSVLSVEPEKKPKAKETPEWQLLDRPEILEGKTYKMKWPGIRESFYITINDAIDNDARIPFEIFITTKNVEAQPWLNALTRTISAVFRRGGNMGFLAEELKETVDARGGAWIKGKYVPSLVAAIGDVVEQHLQSTGHIAIKAIASVTKTGSKCSSCGEHSVIQEAGCNKCLSCGFSTCN